MEDFYQRPMRELSESIGSDREPSWNGRISHPTRYKAFLEQAHGITLLSPGLQKFVPENRISRLIRPIIDLDEFKRSAHKEEIAGKYQIPYDTKLIVYPGGITNSNREDVRDLYKAVKLLNEDGYSTHIVKTGPSCEVFENSFDFNISELSTNLGYLSRERILDLLIISDILIHPGKNNAFNRGRFPCKIPEFLASGVPCLIPSLYNTNGELSGQHCLFLERSDPQEIASKCKSLFDNLQLGSRLAANARNYAERTFDEASNVERLLDFYRGLTRGIAPPERPASLSQRLLATFKRLFQSNGNATHQASADSPATSGIPINPITGYQTDPPENHPCYHRNYRAYCAILEERASAYLRDFQSRNSSLSSLPKISVLLPVYNVDEKWLRRCLDSIINQAYANWELCIADDCSTLPHIRKLLLEYEASDIRIKTLFRETNGHISAATNSAFTLSTGEYLALVDHDDELPPHALAKVAEKIAAHPNAKIIYSDEDKIDENDIRHGPHFKSDWNYDLFLGCNMISHLGVYKRSAFESVSGFREGYEGAQDWDLALRIAENCKDGEIVHIPDILYHWRSIQGSTAFELDEKNYASAAQKRTIETHLERIGVKGCLESVEGLHWRVIYDLPDKIPTVSIIILTKDRIDLLKPCVESILDKTDYGNYRIIIVDNGSSDKATIEYLDKLSDNPKIRVRRDDQPFNFSVLNNRAIDEAQSDLVCLLNNDTEVISSDWLREMVSHAIRPEIGVVGAKLLFPHEHVQHAGVVMGIGGVAGHAFKFLHKDDDGYIHRAKIVSCFSAVTGACMMFEKKLWQDLGGLDDENLPISYNDIDFCLRAREKGLRSLHTPFALLYHKESESRGDPNESRQKAQFESESQFMYRKWGYVIQNDPYYNPNLTLQKEDFTYRMISVP